MLELTNGGRAMSGLDAIEFYESLADMFDEDQKTEEFCNDFEYALNRFRYEIGKSVAVEPNIYKRSYTTYSCGKCGSGVRIEYKFCPNCGKAIDWTKK